MDRSLVGLILMVAVASSGASIGTYQLFDAMSGSLPDNNETNYYYNTTLYYYETNETTVEHHILRMNVTCNVTRTFIGLFNMSLERNLVIKDVFARINMTIPGDPSNSKMEFTYIAFVDEMLIDYGSYPTNNFYVGYAQYVNVWQASSVPFIGYELYFNTYEQCEVFFGLKIWDGFGTVNPINLGVELMILYDLE